MTDRDQDLDLGTTLEMSEWTSTNPGEVAITERTNRAGRDAHPESRLANKGRRAGAVTIREQPQALTRVLARRDVAGQPVGT